MRLVAEQLSGLKVLELKRFSDGRGFFEEFLNQLALAEVGLTNEFVQVNHSRSLPGVLRGLHFQNDPAQGKLVGVIRGRVWDVAVDIRPGSPTRGQHFALELSEDNGRLLWIPAGFAHGFCVLGDAAADVIYFVDAFYAPKSEGGLLWSDPDLKIPWPLSGEPILSAKDLALPRFKDL